MPVTYVLSGVTMGSDLEQVVAVLRGDGARRHPDFYAVRGILQSVSDGVDRCTVSATPTASANMAATWRLVVPWRAAACAAAVLVIWAGGGGSSAAQTVLDPAAPVMVTGGSIRGAVSAGNADIVGFKGIPFAAPPVGELRSRPPEPVIGWDGVRDASESGAICVQNGGQGVTQDEDCLFLNVRAPRETSEPRPVLFWIHGGGYTGGSGSTASYEGTPLAADVGRLGKMIAWARSSSSG